MSTAQPSKSLPRALLIPHKRPLLPPQKHLQNSSAAPATILLKPTSAEHDNPDAPAQTRRTEVSFHPPQPFLDPPAWEAMLARAQERAAREHRGADGEDEEEAAARGLGTGTGNGAESAERRERAREREAEYGSMAIRGRSGLGGRGRRHARPRGRGFGGGGRAGY
ncbi:hypothetical protein N7462_002608 [Penicillium macrosclerotiorum]|uniref:uncharacterized protein n=1 Tax=Penicillium macrosclerotiorum TaxID=303699 RepID=UPI00254951D1|nr:uncharacterized protein N7462_002608 [Penicillium macrosclerotiorum]KAJ5693185.1 hypothetical protein N7462_002608 [Penicillium macrosclerotiorum]